MKGTAKVITIIFDGEPEIGKRYRLAGLLGSCAGETAVATLINLKPHEKTVTLPSGRRETYHDVHAIFEADDGTRFKRVIMPAVEKIFP